MCTVSCSSNVLLLGRFLVAGRMWSIQSPTLCMCVNFVIPACTLALWVGLRPVPPHHAVARLCSAREVTSTPQPACTA